MMASRKRGAGPTQPDPLAKNLLSRPSARPHDFQGLRSKPWGGQILEILARSALATFLVHLLREGRVRPHTTGTEARPRDGGGEGSGSCVPARPARSRSHRTGTAVGWGRTRDRAAARPGRRGRERGGAARRDLNTALPRRWSSLPVAAGQDAAGPPQRLLELGPAARHLDREEQLVDLALQPRQHPGPVIAPRLQPDLLRLGL